MWVTVKAHIAYSLHQRFNVTSVRKGTDNENACRSRQKTNTENHIVARGRVGSVIFVSVEHKLPCNLPVQYNVENVVKSSQVYVRFGTSLYCIYINKQQTTIR